MGVSVHCVVVVHIYWELDMNVIYGILRNDLRVLLTFKKIVKELLEGYES